MKILRGKNIFRMFLLLLSTGAVLSIILYFSLWRPSDNDIQKSLSDITFLQSLATEIMPPSIEYLSHPKNVTPTVAKEFKHNVTIYRDTLASLNQSNAINRNIFNLVNDERMSELERFGKSLSNLSESISVYSTLLTACDPLVDRVNELKSRDEFDKAAIDCSEAISSSSSPYTPFNDQFYTNYQEKSAAVLSATGKFFVIKEKYQSPVEDIQKALTHIRKSLSALDKANRELEKAASVTVDYPITVPPLSIFETMKSDLINKKSSFIR